MASLPERACALGIGYAMLPASRGKGYASEAATACRALQELLLTAHLVSTQ
jgi:RimJ/RimL family protein N-acetyltransferase